MRFPNLKTGMSHKHVPSCELARLLKMSDANFSRSLHGYREFAPHERKRIAEFLRFNESWLFEETFIPATARFRETAMVRPLVETRNDGFSSLEDAMARVRSLAAGPICFNPCELLDTVLERFGRSAYDSVCAELFRVLRARLGVAPYHNVDFVVQPGLSLAPYPASRAGQDAIQTLGNGRKHPLPWTEEK